MGKREPEYRVILESGNTLEERVNHYAVRGYEVVSITTTSHAEDVDIWYTCLLRLRPATNNSEQAQATTEMVEQVYHSSHNLAADIAALRYDLTSLANAVSVLPTSLQIMAMFQAAAERMGSLESQGTRLAAEVNKLVTQHNSLSNDVARAHARLDGLQPQLATAERTLLDSIAEIGERVERLEVWQQGAPSKGVLTAFAEAHKSLLDRIERLEDVAHTDLPGVRHE